jgi:hypothetical protein
MRDDDDVRAEVERLLHRPALGAEHLRVHLQAEGSDEGDEAFQVGEVEGAVLDVEDDGAVAHATGDLDGGGAGIGEPDREAAVGGDGGPGLGWLLGHGDS